MLFFELQRIQDGYFVLQARRNRFQSSQIATYARVYTTTIRNRWHEAAINAGCPVICVPLSNNHLIERFHWARGNVHWAHRHSLIERFCCFIFCLDFTKGMLSCAEVK